MKEDYKYRFIMIGLASITVMALIGYILLHIQVFALQDAARECITQLEAWIDLGERLVEAYE